MQYYILMPGDTEQDTLRDTNTLGDDSGFGVFWANTGFKILQRLIKDKPEVLELVQIIDERNKRYTIEQFLEKISKLKIRNQYD
jgi:hypothetical protein